MWPTRQKIRCSRNIEAVEDDEFEQTKASRRRRFARPADRLPGRLAGPAGRLAALRVYSAILNQKSLRSNIEAVEDAKISQAG